MLNQLIDAYLEGDMYNTLSNFITVQLILERYECEGKDNLVS